MSTATNASALERYDQLTRLAVMGDKAARTTARQDLAQFVVEHGGAACQRFYLSLVERGSPQFTLQH